MSFVYGVVLVVVGAVSANLGNNLVSLGHKNTHEEKLSKEQSSKEAGAKVSSVTADDSIKCKEPEPPVPFFSWTNVGRIIFVIGNLFNFAGFAFGAQSLLSSLESAEFVSNVFFVHYVHAEPITTRMTLATLAIVTGNVLVVVFGEQEAKNFTSDDMIHLYKTNSAYHGYLVLVFILWGVTSYAYSTYHDSRMKKRVLMWRHSFMEPLCYAISSSIVGTQAVLNSKCLALLLDATLSGVKNEFARWYLYMVLGTWLLMVAYWLIRLDQGLALFPPAFIIPLMQVVFMIFAILCGGIYFQEFLLFTTSQYILFSVGVVLICFGVYGLAPLDMQLYVPGDPNAPDPVVLCEQALTANVHSELILHCDHHLHKGEDAELDKMFDGVLHLKPKAHAHGQHEDATDLTDLNLYSSTPGVDASDNSLAASMFDFSRTPKSPDAHKSGTRKVVKRSISELRELQEQQLPPVSTRGTNGLGLAGNSSSSSSTGNVLDAPNTAAQDSSPRGVSGSTRLDALQLQSISDLNIDTTQGQDVPVSGRSARSRSPRSRRVAPAPEAANSNTLLGVEMSAMAGASAHAHAY